MTQINEWNVLRHLTFILNTRRIAMFVDVRIHYLIELLGGDFHCRIKSSPLERTNAYGSSSLVVTQILHKTSSSTNMNLLSTLLEVLGDGILQPHNAGKASRCLKLLIRLSTEAREYALKRNASEITIQA
jgi:hypothetical protein